LCRGIAMIKVVGMAAEGINCEVIDHGIHGKGKGVFEAFFLRKHKLF